jgi:hypothetical protein
MAECFALAHSNVGKPRRDWLNNWWSERSIPACRVGIKEALKVMDVCSTKLLLEKCNGLSLSDQYWIRRQGESVDCPVTTRFLPTPRIY